MTNSKTNQKCWTCAHFQRYDDSETPDEPYGDCRRLPELGYRYENDWFDQYTPFVSDGRDFWCSNWKQTVLTVPPEPVGSSAFIWPSVWFSWTIWNVRASMNVSCGQCNHSQEIFEGIVECRKFPDLPVLDSQIGDIPVQDIIRGEKIWNDPDDWWCGCFERREE